MRKYFYWMIAAALLAVSCQQELTQDIEEKPTAPVALQGEESALIPGEMIIQVDEDLAEQLASGALQTKSAAVNSIFDGLGVTKIERLYPDAGEWEPRHREAGLHRWFRVSYDPAAQPATKAEHDLSAVPGIEYAASPRRPRPTAYFNDPYAPKQWALINDGSLGNKYKAGCDINVEPVWENYTAGSPNVIVAVLDEGVDLEHPDLAAICIPGGPNGSKSFVSGYEGYTIYAADHATHVAGIIAAINNNELGISGIAGGKDGKGGVRIMSCPHMMDDPDDPDNTIGGDEYKAIVWAADHGAVICQNSWGYTFKSEADALAAEDRISYIYPAIDYFIKYAGCDKDGNQLPDSPMKGGVVIFAAGNESWQIGWPAAYEKVIAVGALSAQFTRAYYSNYGDWVDICAPGGDAQQGTYILSTVCDEGYDEMQGTSMACPHVSGVAALIASYYGGPGFTNEMLLERLLGGANPAKAPKYGQIGPALDAMGAFSFNNVTPPDPASGVTSSVVSNSITLTWKVTADPEDKKAYGYLVLASVDADALKKINPRKIPSSVKQMTVTVGTRAVGETISATLTDLEFNTNYYTTVIAYDYAGNYSAASAVRPVKTAKNNPPVIKTDYAGDFRVKPFEKLAVTFTITDPDGHEFTTEVTPGSDALSAEEISAGTLRFVITGNKASHGRYTAKIVATDSYGAVAEFTVHYEILENHPPKMVSELGNLQFSKVGEGMTIDLAKYIQDEDGEPLTFAVNMDVQNVAHLNPNGSSLVLTTLGYGLTTASVTATDACNATATMTFMILVRDDKRPVDLYPNPVVNTLNIRPGTEGQVNITITNKVGAVVWSGSAAAGPFNPLAVDLSGQPGGTYYVRIEGAGVNDVYTIAKK